MAKKDEKLMEMLRQLRAWDVADAEVSRMLGKSYAYGWHLRNGKIETVEKDDYDTIVMLYKATKRRHKTLSLAVNRAEKAAAEKDAEIAELRRQLEEAKANAEEMKENIFKLFA